MATEREIEDEAEALYEDYRAAKPTAVGGAVLPSWKENHRADVRDAWRATAKGSLKRRAEAIAVGGPTNPDLTP